MSIAIYTLLLLENIKTNALTHYQPNLIPKNYERYCNISHENSNNCINTLGCGWCHNNKTKVSSCEYVGVCFIKNNYNISNCEILDQTITCNFIRLLGFFIVIGVMTSTMSCCLSILRHFIQSSNCESLVYFVGMISVLLYSLLPIFLLYYSTFTIFCLATIVQLGISTTYWLCGNTEQVRQVYLNKNHSEYQTIE